MSTSTRSPDHTVASLTESSCAQRCRCGDYTEAAAWNEGLRKKYDRYSAKRKRMEAEEARNIAALIAALAGQPVKDLPPAPAFKPLPSQYAGAPAGGRPVAMRK